MTRPRATEYDAARQEFLALYPNRVKAILRPPGCKTWVSVSKHWPLPDEQIEKAISLQEGETVWGCRWGDSTRFAVLDIDAGSKYHDLQELQKLTASLGAICLTSSLYRSSTSGGWHLYLFFDAWHNCSEVQQTLKAWLTANGYEIRNGTLEVFPSGNGLRLPLQSGFAWLDATGKVLQEREDLHTSEALSHFLSDLCTWASDWQTTKNLIASQLRPADRSAGNAGDDHQKAIDTEGFEGLWNYKLIPERYEAGRQYWQTGLTAKGQRHDAILSIEHYFWHGDEAACVPALPGEWNDEARARLILAWLKEKHNGFCSHINRGNWRKVEAQIKRSVKWRRPSGTLQVVLPYPMTERAIERLIDVSRATGRIWSMDDLKKGNDRREEKTRAKISAALVTLLQQGGRIGRNELARVSGCSPNSVSKHRDLWFLLASGSGDLNPFLDLDPPLGQAALPSGPEEENLFSLLGDTRQTELPRQPTQTAERVAQIDLKTEELRHESDRVDLDGCLTPCAEETEGRRLATEGMEVFEKCPPPPKAIKAPGSSNGSVGLGSACGEFVLGRLRSNNLGHGEDTARTAGQVGEPSGRLFVIPETYWREKKQTKQPEPQKRQSISSIWANRARLDAPKIRMRAVSNGCHDNVSAKQGIVFILPYFVRAERSRPSGSPQLRLVAHSPRGPPKIEKRKSGGLTGSTTSYYSIPSACSQLRGQPCMVTSKRQLSFYAESDVDLYLALLSAGSKTAVLNEAVRSRLITDAYVDLNDGRRPQPFAALSEHEMAEVHSNLIIEELSLNDVDDHVWTIVRETANHSWKQNTARYLALHQAKFKEPFKIKRIRSQEERDEYMRKRPTAISSYYCWEHRTKNATQLTGINMGDLKCKDCGELAEYREYK